MDQKAKDEISRMVSCFNRAMEHATKAKLEIDRTTERDDGKGLVHEEVLMITLCMHSLATAKFGMEMVLVMAGEGWEER